MAKQAAMFALVTFVALFAYGSDAGASSRRQYGASEPKTTLVETSAGRRLVIATDPSGTRVTEERSGREVWRSSSDRHEMKIKDYLRSGAKIIPAKK